MYNGTAAWTYDGTIDFYLDTVNSGVDFWGSSLNDKHWDVVASKKVKKTVNCVDIARIIGSYRLEDNVIVKMDIEGAEYDLIQDFIKKDVMKLIDYIAPELHGPPLIPQDNPYEVYKAFIKLFGTNILQWNRK